VAASTQQGVQQIAAALAQTLGNEPPVAPAAPIDADPYPVGPHAGGPVAGPGLPPHASPPHHPGWPGAAQAPWPGPAAGGAAPPGYGSEPSVPAFDPRSPPRAGFPSGPMPDPRGAPFGHAHGAPPRPNPAFPPPPWMQSDSDGEARFTPQVITLVVVGTICLTIFVVGVVLFVTTKF